jgi:hypothetical protein
MGRNFGHLRSGKKNESDARDDTAATATTIKQMNFVRGVGKKKTNELWR